MNGCHQVHAGFADYLDGRLSGREMQEIDAHLQGCGECASEWNSLRALQASLGALGPVPEPADLPLRIRVAVSQERARSRRSVFAFGSSPGKTRWVRSFAGQRRLCQRGAVMGTVIVAGHLVCQA